MNLRKFLLKVLSKACKIGENLALFFIMVLISTKADRFIGILWKLHYPVSLLRCFKIFSSDLLFSSWWGFNLSAKRSTHLIQLFQYMFYMRGSHKFILLSKRICVLFWVCLYFKIWLKYFYAELLGLNYMHLWKRH